MRTYVQITIKFVEACTIPFAGLYSEIPAETDDQPFTLCVGVPWKLDLPSVIIKATMKCTLHEAMKNLQPIMYAAGSLWL